MTESTPAANDSPKPDEFVIVESRRRIWNALAVLSGVSAIFLIGDLAFGYGSSIGDWLRLAVPLVLGLFFVFTPKAKLATIESTGVTTKGGIHLDWDEIAAVDIGPPRFLGPVYKYLLLTNETVSFMLKEGVTVPLTKHQRRVTPL